MSDDNRIAIRRALVSVYDKTGLEELGRALVDAGVEIVSTGSTAGRLAAAGLPVTPVEQLTGFPECLDGRVKTLHPRVHAGVLADLRNPDHERQLAELDIAPFQLVVVNLYPFTDTVNSGASPDECVEQIDIGGPSMVRAAAKNHANVAVVVAPSGYADVIAALDGGFTLAQRRSLAGQAFQHTASYDVAVATWFGGVLSPTDEIDGQHTGFPSWVGQTYERADVLRYGENPHQRAALYVNPGVDGLAQAEQLHGKQMSYNNYLDTNAAVRAAHDFDTPTVAIIKHANPCGIATADTVAQAHLLANACDPASAFGGVIAVNREVTVAMARQVNEIFTEVIVAPSYEDGAVEILSSKPSIRVLRTSANGSVNPEFRQICGGLLLQTSDTIGEPGDVSAGWTLVTGEPADAEALADLEFAWRASRAVKSNAILLASGLATVGVGMGQVSRVDAAKLAVLRAGDRAVGSVAASDAYFPFADGAEVLLEAGIKAIVEPGGSVRDQLTIDACAKAGVTLYFTGVRHFFH